MKFKVILLFFWLLSSIIVLYAILQSRSTNYHVNRLREMSKSEPPPFDMVEFVLQRKYDDTYNWHMNAVANEGGKYRKEVYAFNLKQRKDGEYVKEIMYKLIGELDDVWGSEMGHSIYRDDEKYNYYVILVTSHENHKIIQNRYYVLNK